MYIQTFWKIKKNGSKESDKKGRMKQRLNKSGTCKNKNEKKGYQVRQECVGEVESTESMKEVEKKPWLIHYEQLSEEFVKVVREKCVGCQNNEDNQLKHELCSLASVKEQGSSCFEETYSRVEWTRVLDLWYERVLEMPVTLNPEMLYIFGELVDPQEEQYKNRLGK